MRESRSMLVYEMQVLQVDLSDSSQMGIQWKAFVGANGPVVSKTQEAAGIVNKGNTAADVVSSRAISVAAGSGIDSLNTFIYGPKFSLNLLLNFLKSQGDVKTISQPRIGLMNGTKGLLRVGQSTTYVSKVGSINSSGLNQVTVDTKDLKTGLEISLAGEEHDKTIYTRINLSITELLQFTKYIALGTDLTLPEVADRELKTQVRSRPGDTILLGGITITRAEQSRQMGASANNSNKQVRQSELVIAIKPRLVSFLPAGNKKDAAPVVGIVSSADSKLPVAVAPLHMAKPAVAAAVQAAAAPVPVVEPLAALAPVTAPVVSPVPEAVSEPLPSVAAVPREGLLAGAEAVVEKEKPAAIAESSPVAAFMSASSARLGPAVEYTVEKMQRFWWFVVSLGKKGSL
jgi:type II secretory pathway component GspD/PulD (secretin)